MKVVSVYRRLALISLLFAASLFVMPGPARCDVSVSFSTEIGYGYEPAEISKAESVLGLGWQDDFSQTISYSVLGLLEWDVADNLRVDHPLDDNYSSINGPFLESQNGEVSLAEAYLDFAALNGLWRVGKQQVVWGQADGLKVIDVVNPQNYREFNLPAPEDSRIATWIINAEFEVGSESTMQLILIPDTTYHKLADKGTTFEFTSPKYLPWIPPGTTQVQIQQTDRPDWYLEKGIRFRTLFAGWDWTLNYLRHFQDAPVFYADSDSDRVYITPTYENNNLFGMTVSTAWRDAVIRMELGYNTNTFHISSDTSKRGIGASPELASVIGVDYLGITDWLISYQWFQSSLLDYDRTILRDETRMQHTLLLQRTFWNEVLKMEFFILYSDEDQDGQLRGRLTYLLEDNIEVWLGADAFYGNHEGQFGQFDDTDRLLLGIETGF